MVCEKTGNLVPMQTENVLPSAVPMRNATELEGRVLTPEVSGSITADPNPCTAPPDAVAKTTLSWMSYGTSKVEVHVGAPEGPLFASTGPGYFSQTTGEWVRNGTTFYLQNTSGGLPLALENTIATVTVKLV
jgi:hypothetical protein